MPGALGKYRLETRLGGGGMAEVFLAATHGAEGFSRRVAIKRVLPGFSDNPAFAGMFVAEAQISSRLVHPNIVSVLDFDRDAEQRLFLVMELVEGRDLDALVSTGIVPFPVVIYVISEVLRGLGYAHDLPTHGGAHASGMRGVVHRDVSPHNVLLSWEGAVKVSDFGIAKARSASEATASQFIKGKPAYMSPEQANGQALDGRSDLFAVGIMLWEMLVGRRLFFGDDTRATLAAVLFGQVPRPRAIRGDIPKDLERVTMKLLERDLPTRYSTAEEALGELLDCADAPRAGREALIGLLAERFPNEAQVRQSMVRGRGASTPPMSPMGPRQVTPHEIAATALGGAPAYPAPSMSSMMAAPTGTIDIAPRKPNVALRIAIVVLVMAASGAATFAIVAGARGGDGSSGAATAQDAALTATVADAAAQAPDAAEPAGTVPRDAPVAPVDAPDPLPVPDADSTPTKKDASPGRDGHAVSKKLGRLEVRAFPVLTITLGGRRLGDTPVNKQVPVGKHTLRMTNSATGYDERVTIEITENQTTTIERMK